MSRKERPSLCSLSPTSSSTCTSFAISYRLCLPPAVYAAGSKRSPLLSRLSPDLQAQQKSCSPRNNKTPSRAMLRPRRRRNWLMRLFAGSGLNAAVTPVSSVPPSRGPKYPRLEWGCQEAGLSRAFPFHLLPDSLDLLEHVLVQHDSLPHQDPPHGISSGHKLPIRRGQGQAESAEARKICWRSFPRLMM